MKTSFLKKSLALLLALLSIVSVMTVSIGAAEAEPKAETQGIQVRIESVMRGYEDDMNLRSSELLVANVIGYKGNPQELTYEWTNTLGTYLYVYNSRNMYYINNTDGEIEIYNDKISPSSNMTSMGRSHRDKFEGTGYCWAAIYGSNTSGAQTSIADKNAYNGTIGVTVKDKNGNILGSASHEGKVTTSGFWIWETTEYDGIVDHSLKADMDDVTIGIFEGDTRNVKDLLGESAILHITCVESTVNEGKVTSGGEYISLSGDADTDYFITGVKAGTSTDVNGDAQVELSIQKNNCKFHENSSATATTTVYVFKKPTTSTTAYTLTLTGNIDERCTYYINGNAGERTYDKDGKTTSILFTGLTPNTNYQVEVRGHYKVDNQVDKIAYAYVYDTTKPVYSGTVEVYLDGTYDSANHKVTDGKKVNLQDVSPYSTIYAKEVNGTEFIKLEQKKDAEGNLIDGTYGSVLVEGSYHLYYEANAASQIDQQLLTIHNADRTRYLFYNSVTYYDGSETDQKTQNFAKEYYVSESTVNTIAKVPEKEGHVFIGWKDRETDLIYKADSLLTDHLSRPVVLDAVWEKSVKVYVNFEINHKALDNSGFNTFENRHNISFDLMSKNTGSVGDFSDVFDAPVTIEWDGKSDLAIKCDSESFDNNMFKAEHTVVEGESEITTYTEVVQLPIIPNSLRDIDYNVEVIKSGYELLEVRTEEIDDDKHIYVKLQYAPENADLKFKVKLDEASEKLVEKYPEYQPAAVHVKVLCYYIPAHEGVEVEDWYHILQHHDTYETLHLQKIGDDIYATGSYPVWAHDGERTYYYRIKVVSYVLPDGRIVSINESEDNVVYTSTDERYIATINVEGGGIPTEGGTDLHGAYFVGDEQQGELTAEINIKTHTITFDPVGGKFSDGDTEKKVVSELIEVPDLSLYTPTREGGYVFDGWHVKDEQGQLVSATIKSGDELFGDITLYAEWKAPRTIEGDVFVAGYYYVNNDPDDVAKILEHDRTHAVTVYLQKLLANDYAETVDTQQVTVTYEDANGENIGKPFGTAFYSFTQVPDDGHDYRILIQNPNYIVSYQNEPESLDPAKINNFKEEYSETENFEAVYEHGETNVANINAFMRFDPHEFDLRYKVIASSIGDGYRPSMTEILVHCDDGKSGPNPQSWPVITQMADGEGQENALGTDGISVAEYDGVKTDLIKYPVWRTKTDGHNLYDYAVSLDSYTIGGTQKDFNAQEAPFYVSYNGSARYSAREDAYPEHQSQLLTVELTPKRYTITFEPGFVESTDDYITYFAYRVAPGQYEVSHIWSYKTVIDEEPTRPGYKFIGWMDKNGNLINTTTIDASVAENITLTAKWDPLFTVTFHTNNDNVDSKGIFRVYYEQGDEGGAPSTAKFFLDEKGRVPETYDLPALTDAENNLYIFKGWYLDPENEDNPISWDDVYTTHTDVYAHWIKVESVQQDADDLKKIPYADAMYPEYDLAGVQIRTAENDPIKHGGDAAPGLRFIAVLSERVYEELNEIETHDSKTPNLAKGAEYGFVIALTDTAKYAAKYFEVPEDEYRIQYSAENVNGKNTSNEFFYVENLICSDYVDHCNYDDYRLYTSVITYEEYEDDELLEAQSTPVTARPYLRYTDANGLLRTYYNNYTGKSFSFGGCSADYNSASENEVLKPAYEN